MEKQGWKKNWLKMSLKMSVSTVVAVMLMLSNQTQAETFPEPGPSGILYLDKFEQQSLAKTLKECSLARRNLDSYKKAYDICATRDELSPAWWQTYYGVSGIFVLGILTGVLVK